MSVEDLIRSHCWWEDPDSALVVGTDEFGRITVTDPEWRYWGVGETLEQALEDFLEYKGT